MLTEKSSERKPQEVQVRNIGTVLKTDENGFVISQSSPEKIQPPWVAPVEDIKKVYLDNLGEDTVHSIYIKGSVSRGTPIEDVSDIDALAVVYSSTEELNLDWIRQEADRLRLEYPYSTDFDFAVIPYEEVVSGKRRVARCLLKVSSACIYGDDLAEQLPRVKPGPDCFICSRNIGKYVEKKIELLEDKTKEIDPVSQSKWVAKYLIRAAFELVMEREKVFTRDLYPSYEMFSKYYPEKEVAARRVLEAAVKQDASREELLTILNDYGRWLVIEKEKQYPEE